MLGRRLLRRGQEIVRAWQIMVVDNREGLVALFWRASFCIRAIPGPSHQRGRCQIDWKLVQTGHEAQDEAALGLKILQLMASYRGL